jgi:large subunit ribosomal protein L5
MKMEPRLKTHYTNHVRPKLQEEFGYVNPHQIPKVVKVVINVGSGDGAKDQKLLDSIIAELVVISGQKPLMNRARRSISNFQLREGMPIGASVTMRGEKMWFFLDRLISTVIPRVRDFRGLKTRSFDGRGNYTMAVKEQIVFPEINYEKVRKIHGMDITVVTSTNKDDEGLALLRELGFPFRGAVPVQVGATA